MAYYVDLFSPETLARFMQSDRTVTGFQQSHRSRAEKVRPGDKFVCYLTGASAWFAILEVENGPFWDDSPIFAAHDDPFVIRFHVRPVVILTAEEAPSIKEEHIWKSLSFTKDNDPRASAWRGRVRGSLNRLDEADGQFLERTLLGLTVAGDSIPGPVGETATPDVDDSAQDGSESQASPPLGIEGRESIRVQAKLAEIGSRMGMSVWIPSSDRGRVAQHLPADGGQLVEELPLIDGDRILKTVQQIDVLWLKGRLIVRAFEVEHTTAVYSGLLRMADLLALLPNRNIPLHIVASSERRAKVLQEIRRPVFEYLGLENLPLADQCTFLSYESVNDLHKDPNLPYLTPDVLKRYEERA
ncbi:MAG: hypothetical protein F4052_07805 [Dehalococcoidia bacterium]|nr:hypothetical protein [Dehalococcoidia bacterium]